MARNQIDTGMLQAALAVYQAERESIAAQIAEIKKQLGRRAGRVVTASPPTARKRRSMSAVAPKRIAAGQKKRRAAYRKMKKAK